MQKLSETEKEKLLKELKYNAKTDFEIEYPRIANLQKEIIEKYDLAGIDLVLQSEGLYNCPILPNKKHKEIMSLLDVDSSCIWKKYAHNDPGAIIDAIFNDIKDRLPRFLPELKKRCKHIFAIKWSKKEWALGYFIKQKERPYYTLLIGKEPNENPELRIELQDFKWKIPTSLKNFYAIHDGFGEFSGSLDNKLLPISWLRSMKYLIDNTVRSEYARIILDKKATEEFTKKLEKTIAFPLENILPFFYYSFNEKKEYITGQQCFYRNNIEENNPSTVFCKIDYNENWKIAEISTNTQSFFQFLDEQFLKLIVI